MGGKRAVQGSGAVRKKSWWISWEEKSEDYRPLHDPPNAAVLGWWCTGQAGDDSYYTLVAWVVAPTEAQAKKAVLKDWPGKNVNWGFCSEKVEDDLTDRFPVKNDWSGRRIAAYREGTVPDEGSRSS